MISNGEAPSHKSWEGWQALAARSGLRDRGIGRSQVVAKCELELGVIHVLQALRPLQRLVETLLEGERHTPAGMRAPAPSEAGHTPACDPAG